MWSFWELDQFIGKPDLCIIGSGIVGLTCAIRYKKKHPEANVMILERGSLPSGASTKNAGFACFGSPSEILMDLKNEPEEQVLERIKKRWHGLRELKLLLGNKQIGFENNGSYELFTQNDQQLLEETLQGLPYLNQLIEETIGFTPYSSQNNIIKDSNFNNVLGAIHIKGEGQINTGKMMFHLLQKANEMQITILNGMHVEDIHSKDQHVVINTNQGEITAKKVAIANNGFAKQLMKLDVTPARAQVLITKPIENIPFKGTFHLDQGYYYFRNVGNRVLFGGGRNLDFKTEETTENELNPKIQDHLTELLHSTILPKTLFEIDQRWTGIMGVHSTLKSPIIKQIDHNIFAAVRLGGMGIAIGSLLGKELAGLINTYT